jgi:hypothetical protein
MLCCWISPDRNSVSIARRAPNIGSRERQSQGPSLDPRQLGVARDCGRITSKREVISREGLPIRS